MVRSAKEAGNSLSCRKIFINMFNNIICYGYGPEATGLD